MRKRFYFKNIRLILFIIKKSEFLLLIEYMNNNRILLQVNYYRNIITEILLIIESKNIILMEYYYFLLEKYFSNPMSEGIELKKLLRTNPRKLIRKEDRGLRKKIIEARKKALIDALKVPPAINQFRFYLSDEEMKNVNSIFEKYKPETRSQHKLRLKNEKENGRIGPKPNIVKCGSKHVTYLIEQKRAKLVLIACDVDPIEIVMFLPTLCKKMNIPYALVKSKYDLGRFVNQKSTATVCLCDVDKEDKGKFEKLIKDCNAKFSDNYEAVMKEWGLPIIKEKK